MLPTLENSASHKGPMGELSSLMAVGTSRQGYSRWTDKETEAQRGSKSLRESVWLDTEVWVLSHHVTLR